MAQIDVYVDPDASGNNDGTSWTDAYTSLSLAESSEQTDLVSAGDNIVFHCRASSGTADTTESVFSGWVTGIGNDIKIVGDDFPSDGIWSTSSYRLSTTTTSALAILEEYVTVEKLQIQNTNGQCVRHQISTTNLLVLDKVTMLAQGDGGFYMPGGVGVAELTNCLIYNDGSEVVGSEGVLLANGTSIDMFNCTVYGFNDGIERDNGTVNVTNCAVFGNSDDFDGTMTIVNCASDDGDGTNPQTLDSTNNYENEFTDITTGDFSVTDNGSSLYNAGTNTGAPSDDIIGTSRPQATTTDIGAFELIVSSGTTLTIQNINQSQVLETLILLQNNILSIDNILQSQVIDVLILIQQYLLNINNLLQTQTIDNLDIIQANILVVNDLTQSQIIDNIELSTGLALIIDSISQNQTLENIDLTQANVLVVNDIIQTQLLENLTLPVDVILEIADLIQNQNIDILNLTQQNILNIDGINQLQSINNLILDTALFLQIANIIQNQSIDELNLSQQNILQINNLLQTQEIENVSFIFANGKVEVVFVMKTPNITTNLKIPKVTFELK